MISKTKRSSRWILHPSPWIIIGSAGILLVIVVVLASQNYSREKKYMSHILSEKGAALILAVEAGARTGMMCMQWGGQQVQTLLEETGRIPDVLFLTVVDPDGRVLAHSDRSRIGTRFNQGTPMTEWHPADVPGWRLIEMNRYGRAFIVFSTFRLIPDTERPAGQGTPPIQGDCTMMGNGQDWCFPRNPAGKNPIIFVGLNPHFFDNARREDIRNTMIISGVLVVVGLTGFISMFWMQSYHAAKQALLDTAAFADQVATSLPVGLIATDKDGKIAFYNSAAQRITAIDLSKALGQDPENVLPGHLCELKETLNRGEAVYEAEMACEFTAGKIVPVSISTSKIINEAGQFVGQVLLIRDLGEVRRLQAEIRRKEKMAAIGELAAGVAHEIRNPLSSIKGIASYYKSKFKDGSQDKEMAGVMIAEVDRLSRVISELLEFARPAKLNLKPSKLNDLLAHSVRLIQQEAMAKNIHIQLNLTPDSAVAEIDPDRLAQCLLNIYLNALQAMEHGGRLTIASAIRNDRTVTITITDNGSGIRSEDLKNIFLPYFTTRPKGTGLGLAIVHKIVEAHQGSIKVRSTLGQGSEFSIILPITSPK